MQGWWEHRSFRPGQTPNGSITKRRSSSWRMVPIAIRNSSMPTRRLRPASNIPGEEFLALPSRLSAEPTDWVERQTLLDKVSRDGFLSGYRGLRVAKSGRRFIIEDGVVWELIDGKGMRHGQAATFRSWRNL